MQYSFFYWCESLKVVRFHLSHMIVTRLDFICDTNKSLEVWFVFNENPPTIKLDLEQRNNFIDDWKSQWIECTSK